MSPGPLAARRARLLTVALALALLAPAAALAETTVYESKHRPAEELRQERHVVAQGVSPG